LAQNRTGFRNLVKLASAASLEGFYYKPRIDKELLQAHHEGIICLSGCVSSELSHSLIKGGADVEDFREAREIAAWFHQLFGDRYFVEIMNNGVEIQRMQLEAAVDLAKRLGLPLVATSDAHYVQREDAVAQDVLLCINTGKFRTDTNRMRMENDSFFLRSPEEMYAQFPGLEDAVARSQEIANSVSHGIGFLAALAAFPVLILGAFERGAPAVIGAAVFTVTMTLLYFTSTLYHALAQNRAKQVFQILDHGAIYLLIAGTYTPFTLGVLRGPWGWTLLGLIWGLAIAGVVIKANWGIRYPRLSTAWYLAMGWLILAAAKPLWLLLPKWGLFWLVAGGVAYTAGVGFYAARQLRYGHFVWHLFVLCGTACHFVAVWRYAA